MTDHSPNENGSLSLGDLAMLVERLPALVAQVERLTADLASAREPYLNSEQAAAYLATKPRRIKELVASGRLRPYRDGRRLLFRRQDLDAALVQGDPESQRP